MKPLNLYFQRIIKRWFRPCGFNTQLNEFASSAISFRLPSDSISAAASFRLTLVFCFRSRRFLGRKFHGFNAASFSLSDPLCFGILSSASVSGSDYSASVLPFLLFPIPPHSCFPGARFRSRFLGFPFLSGLISRAFLPGSCTRLYCSFPFALPCFAPTAVPQVLTFCFHFRYFPLSVCFLSSALFKASSYSAFCFSFPSLPGFA